MANKSTETGGRHPNNSITPDAYLFALRRLRLKFGEISLNLERAEQAVDNRLISGYTFYEDRVTDELTGAMAGALECYNRMHELVRSKIEFTI